MSKYNCKSVHLNEIKLAQVLSGELPPNTPVGEIMDEEGVFETLFVHFTKETGEARRSEKGKVRLNARKQTPRAAQGATVTAEQLQGVTAEQLAAIAAILGR